VIAPPDGLVTFAATMLAVVLAASATGSVICNDAPLTTGAAITAIPLTV
jgi:hypothetical protein